MPDVTPGLVLLEIRHAVAYQRARFPNTYPEINTAADKLVRSKAFADFVDDCLAPAAPGPGDGHRAFCDCEDCH